MPTGRTSGWQRGSSYFWFEESPLVAFRLFCLFAKPPSSTGGLPPASVSLLVPQGSASELASEYLAAPAQASSFVPLADQRKLPWPRSSRSLLLAFPRPRAPFPVTPELLSLLTKPLRKDSVLPSYGQNLLFSEEGGLTTFGTQFHFRDSPAGAFSRSGRFLGALYP